MSISLPNSILACRKIILFLTGDDYTSGLTFEILEAPRSEAVLDLFLMKKYRANFLRDRDPYRSSKRVLNDL
jgi:hypothetical protein